MSFNFDINLTPHFPDRAYGIYQRIQLFMFEVTDSVLRDDDWPISDREYMSKLTSEDLNKIGFVLNDAHRWACERSPSGLSILKIYDPGEFSFRIHGFVQLTPKDITFWKLKHGSNN